MSSKNIQNYNFDNEDCTVDTECSTTPEINRLYQTKFFENTLIKNKGKV